MCVWSVAYRYNLVFGLILHSADPVHPALLAKSRNLPVDVHEVTNPPVLALKGRQSHSKPKQDAQYQY